ncbi:hypothetical protein RCL1_004631 [Eukaryota sp. TZLM3-RCL]
MSKAAAKKFQARPHSNPLKPNQLPGLPNNPIEAESFIASLFPETSESKPVTILDIGCGYGALLPVLSKHYPSTRILGLEIRGPVVEYANNFISTERQNSSTCLNVSVLRCNAMRHLPRLFHKGQMERLFFLYVDPNLKQSHERRRILSYYLLNEYAFVLKTGGLLYFACDLKEVFEYGTSQLDLHPLFERISEEELASDEVFNLLNEVTADADRAKRKDSGSFKCCYRRVENFIPKIVIE